MCVFFFRFFAASCVGYSEGTCDNNNKWSKNFDERPHRRGVHWENLMGHLTASAAGPSERTLQAADVLFLARPTVVSKH